jgi:cytochrome c oxidase cbb3-type subunit 3
LGVARGATALHERHLEAELVMTTPEDVAHNPVLMRFAARVAQDAIAAHCAACHGPQLRGDRTWGVPDLTAGTWLYGSGQISEIEKSITYGIRSHNPRGWNLAVMPAFGSAVPSTQLKLAPLSPTEIAEVSEFVLAARRRPADNAAAARGASVYQGPGGCYDCHGADLRGDAAIGAPDLTDPVTLYGDGSRQSIYRSIAEGHRGSCPAWVRQLSAVQIRALATYIHSVSHRAASTSAGLH